MNPFKSINNPFNKEYKPQPKKRLRRRKLKIVRVEVVHQPTNTFVADIGPGGVVDMAIDLADKQGTNDIIFIGFDDKGYEAATWSIEEVLAGVFASQVF